MHVTGGTNRPVSFACMVMAQRLRLAPDRADGHLRCLRHVKFQLRVAGAISRETEVLRRLHLSGSISGKMEDTLANSNQSPVTQWRRRRKRQGFVRVEIQVRKEDAALVREVAAALVDPEHEAETRKTLCEKFAAPGTKGLKTLLASAPLEGIDLERPRDFGRDAQ